MQGIRTPKKILLDIILHRHNATRMNLYLIELAVAIYRLDQMDTLPIERRRVSYVNE